MRDLKKGKIIMIGFVLLVFILVIGLIIIKSNNESKLRSNKRVEYNVEGLVSINLKEFSEKVNEKGNNIFFISNSHGSFDGKFAQSLREIQKQLKCNIYVIDIINIDSKDESYGDYENIINKATKDYNKDKNFELDTLMGTTPLLIVSNNGKIIDTILGGQDDSVIKEFIENNL